MHWSVSRTKSSGVLRTQFSSWAIPKSIRGELTIMDGDHCIISVSHINYCATLTLKVTSGGEIRLPKTTSDNLQRQASDHPNSSVAFVVHIEDERQTTSASFEEEVAASCQLSSEVRRARLEKAPRKPIARRVSATIYDRNPDVVAEVLDHASGRCERCQCDAPFLRRSDGKPYLEVHHKVQLANGGDDTVANAEALCPNCHRRSHHGHLDG